MHNLTGICAVNIYITQLLIARQEATDGKFPVSPVLGAFIVAMTNLIGCLIAFIPMKLLGRKTILMMGYGGMSVSLFVIGLALLCEWDMTMFGVVCLFTFIF